MPILIFAILYSGSQISLLSKNNLAVSDFYLTGGLAVLLTYWIGPKLVVPLVFINSVVTSHQWGTPVEKWPLWFLFAIPETLFVTLSWFLFIKLSKGKYWLPDTRNLILFLVAGVMTPAVIEAVLLQSMLVWSGALSFATYWKYIASNLLGEFSSIFFLTLPALYYVTPYLTKKNMLPPFPGEIEELSAPNRFVLLEIGLVFLCLLTLVFFIEFRKMWFVYGLFSLYVAIRAGFGPAILSNLFILMIIYVLPKIFTTFGVNKVGDYLDVINIFLGACLLFVFAAITGRVISDIKITEAKLIKKNTELEKTNEELDRFVYSVSHDLSAPLKSILGLVNISKLTTDLKEQKHYMNSIERSVKKLESFIGEVLDYSKNKRKELVVEQIELKKLCEEILENLREAADAKSLEIKFELNEPKIIQDKTRLKIILNNLLSNAVKFQKSFPGHKPYVKISSFREGDDLKIEIEDNGEGIRKEELEPIFNMFYRGNQKSYGSGLGLYIAKEATSKINGSIDVRSEYGKGSTFVLHFKNLDENGQKVAV